MNRQNESKGPGTPSAGQSGADQGLSETAEANAESVQELVQEGQFFEANVVDAIEKAPESDVEVRTRNSLKTTCRLNTWIRTDYSTADARFSLERQWEDHRRSPVGPNRSVLIS